MLAGQNSSDVGEAKVYISHVWKFNFFDTVNAIVTYITNLDPSDGSVKWSSVIWFDLFSNNQHFASTIDFTWWCIFFSSDIEKFGHTIMVLSP